MHALRLAELKNRIAPYVGSGRNAQDPQVLEYINRAVELLMEKGDWSHSVHRLKMQVANGHIALPYGYSTVLKHAHCESPMLQWSMGYEFLGSGPGAIDFGNDSGRVGDLVDADWHPTWHPLGNFPMKIAAFSLYPQDVGKVITIRCTDSLGNTMGPPWFEAGSALQLPISSWGVSSTTGAPAEGVIDLPDARFSVETIYSIWDVQKPETKGYITLVAGLPDENKFGFLAKWMPLETSPRYRRYRVTGYRHDHLVQGTEGTLLILAKREFNPLRYDDEVVPIQHTYAIQLMVESLHEMSRGDAQKAMLFEANAVRHLREQKGDLERNRNEFDVISTDGAYTWGSSLNLN